MPHWYEVFENSEVQYLTRRQVATLTGIAVGTALASIAGYEIGVRTQVPMWLIGSSIAASWVIVFWWVLQRFGKLRRLVWCIKFSDRHLVGYDYARRKTTLDWIKIERIILGSKGLIIDGPPSKATDGRFTTSTSIEIPHLFPDFATLSHRIFEYANLYEIPVFIDGQPWEQLDVYHVFPFLQDSPSASEPDTN